MKTSTLNNAGYKVELVSLSEIHSHPRNYREHPDDQLAHLIESINAFGFYKNIIISKDGIVLAGHGIVKAARKMNIENIPAIRLNIDSNDPKALKILVGDNEIAHLGEIDDRQLTEMLKEIKEIDLTGLLGTGFDDMMLANLAFISRPQSEIKDYDAAAEWAGMPEYESREHEKIKIVIQFRTKEDREKFAKEHKLDVMKQGEQTWSVWWPAKERMDISSVRFEG